MNRRNPLFALTLLAVAAGLALTAVSPVPAATDDEREYRLLVERNIFLRDRRRPTVYRPTATRPMVTGTYDSDAGIVLTGVARCDGEYVAFFENTRTGSTTRAAASRPVGKGEITAITLDGVEYKHGGSAVQIKIGYSLTGSIAPRSVASVSSAVSAVSAEPTAPSGTPGTPVAGTVAAPPTGSGSSGTADLAEQMRRRRQQELEK